VVNPSVNFVVPVGGTWNVQWATDPRPTSTTLPATVAPPVLTAHVTAGGGTLRFPADEVFVFTNREMYATAMLFNLPSSSGNITPIPGDADGTPVANCEPRINSDGFVEYCDASFNDGCRSCVRTPPEGGLVVFPNANMWLAGSWTNAQDYYHLRSCSSDLTTCVANFRGFIDARYCGPADPHCLNSTSTTVSRRCNVQSLDRDTALPRPYRGPAQQLFDAFQCHIGTGPDTGYGVTTLFANYGSIGACWATTPTDPACRYVKPGGGGDDDDDEEDRDGDRDPRLGACRLRGATPAEASARCRDRTPGPGSRATPAASRFRRSPSIAGLDRSSRRASTLRLAVASLPYATG